MAREFLKKKIVPGAAKTIEFLGDGPFRDRIQFPRYQIGQLIQIQAKPHETYEQMFNKLKNRLSDDPAGLEAAIAFIEYNDARIGGNFFRDAIVIPDWSQIKGDWFIAFNLITN